MAATEGGGDGDFDSVSERAGFLLIGASSTVFLNSNLCFSLEFTSRLTLATSVATVKVS